MCADLRRGRKNGVFIWIFSLLPCGYKSVRMTRQRAWAVAAQALATELGEASQNCRTPGEPGAEEPDSAFSTETLRGEGIGPRGTGGLRSTPTDIQIGDLEGCILNWGPPCRLPAERALEGPPSDLASSAAQDMGFGTPVLLSARITTLAAEIA